MPSERGSDTEPPDRGVLAHRGSGDPAGVDGLELEVRHRNGTVIVLVRGEIDLATAPELAHALDDFGEEQSVVVDIAEVSSLDARGISVVVDHDRRLRARGHRIVLRGASPLVRRVLEITGDLGLVEDLVER